MGSLGFLHRTDASARELSRASCAWASARLEKEDAVLVIAEPKEEAIVLGAFQRATELRGDERSSGSSGSAILLRGSGGGAARVGPGTIWMQLSLTRVDALVACTPDKLLNRYVRPLLRALTLVSSVPVSYFGRDWISAKHRPVALVAFAHEAANGKALFEAIIGVTSSSFVDGDVHDRPSFLGKSPATLQEISGRAIDPRKVAEAIMNAYGTMSGVAYAIAPPLASDDAAAGPALMIDEPAWTATREEAIGRIAAGRDASGRLRVGGELMASRDAIARLEDRVAALPSDARSADAVGALVDEALTTGGAITFGVRSLASVRDAILEALEKEAREGPPSIA